MNTMGDSLASRLAGAAPEDKQEAARSLESFFLRWALSQVRPSSPEANGGGFAGGVFQEMFEESLADQLAAAGGLGLAESLAQTMSEPSESAPVQAQAARPPALSVSPSEAARAYRAGPAGGRAPL
jgi:Rod binding domain-containing protein